MLLMFAGLALLPGEAAEAREIGWRAPDRIARSGILDSLQDVLRHLFSFSRGGMDPNGES